MNQFEVKVKFTKELPNSTLKRVTEVHLLTGCMSFTEAETIANKIILNEVRGETSVEAIKKASFLDIFHHPSAEGDWFKCVTKYSIENDDTGKESIISNTYLVQAGNIDEASSIIKKYMGDILMKDNFHIPAITKTSVVSVIHDKVLTVGDEDYLVSVKSEEE